MLSNQRRSPAPQISLVLHKFSRGGSDRVAAHLARGFAAAGLGVELVVINRGGEIEQTILGVSGDQIPVRYLGNASIYRPLDLLLGLPRLWRHFSKSRPHVVISTANNTSLVTAIAAGLVGVWRPRIVLKTTNPIASSRHRGLHRRFRLWTYRTIFAWIDAVWTLSDDESAEMSRAFPRYSRLFRSVYNPYVTEAMMASRVQLTRAKAPFKTVLSIARLTAQKRLDRLIAAFAKLPPDGTRLLILGEGEDRAKLEALLARLGVADRVSMPGYQDVTAKLHEADLFVLTSDYEGLPAALVEAMAANCPVLSTPCFPSAQSLLGSLTGAGIIQDASPEALARQMQSFLGLARPSMLCDVASRYSIKAGVNSHLAELRRILQPR